MPSRHKCKVEQSNIYYRTVPYDGVTRWYWRVYCKDCGVGLMTTHDWSYAIRIATTHFVGRNTLDRINESYNP